MISVVIPAYNCERYIRQAVESALKQNVKTDMEILVIDDCSTDGTKHAVQELIRKNEERKQAFSGKEKRNSREILYFSNKKNLGVAETRNKGIRRARGNYLAFLDGDDWWDREKLQKQLELIQKEDAVLVYSGRELMQPLGGSTGKVIHVPGTATYKSLLRTNCIPCSSVLMKTKAAREFYMCNDELHEDYILWLKVLQKYGTAYGIDEPLLKSRLSQGGKSRNKLKSAKMHYGVYKYMGIPWWKAVWLFLCYALNGVRKYR